MKPTSSSEVGFFLYSKQHNPVRLRAAAVEVGRTHNLSLRKLCGRGVPMRQRYQVRLRVLGADKHKARRSGAGNLHGRINLSPGSPLPLASPGRTQRFGTRPNFAEFD